MNLDETNSIEILLLRPRPNEPPQLSRERLHAFHGLIPAKAFPAGSQVGWALQGRLPSGLPVYEEDFEGPWLDEVLAGMR